jgi:hypothetical protein
MKGNIMFQEGNLVRPITEDGSGEVMSVISVEEDSNTVELACLNGVTSMDMNDLELVTDGQIVHEEKMKPMKKNVPTRTEQDIHDDIGKMFIQVVQWLRAHDCEEKISIEVNGENFNDSNLEISFNVRIGYESTITSKNIFTSARIALERSNEDSFLKPLSIPMFVED